ncbi:MAG: hypothetical protein HETSPECPRED_001295 [Heterodermia speciosa]|uniref:Uncharacterized protein n=1 Tax=Heterodermia speciosa TaxID=116794 RepID=A0A8H3EWN4_9LECA|nr:MAG: hypothetical protein HETSPECPRED_001295 [Heterodermia speciosa]
MPQSQLFSKPTIPKTGASPRYYEHVGDRFACQSWEAYTAARLTPNELAALILYFKGTPLATAEFWTHLSKQFSWEIYAIDPRFWDSMKRIGRGENEARLTSEANGQKMEQLPVDRAIREWLATLIAQASGMLGLSEPSWRLRSWGNLYSEPPSVLGKDWRDLLAKKLHAQHKFAKKVVGFND